MSFFDRFKPREKEYRETKEETSNRKTIERGERIRLKNKAKEKVTVQKEKFTIAANERYAAAIAERERALQKGTWKAEHPKTMGVLKRAEKTGGRIVQFGGKMAKEGTVSYKQTRRTMGGTNPRIRQTGRRSFGSPIGGDTSLSSAIARNDWHSEGRNLMDREFFRSSSPGSPTTQVPQSERDILGPRLDRELVSSGNFEKKSKIRYY
jgi:hypothetical protein